MRAIVPYQDEQKDGEIWLEFDPYSGPISEMGLPAPVDINITDSKKYLQVALQKLMTTPWQLAQINISLECSTPRLDKWIPKISNNIARLTGLQKNQNIMLIL